LDTGNEAQFIIETILDFKNANAGNQISLINGDPHFQTMVTIYDPLIPGNSFKQYQTSGIGNFVDDASWASMLPVLQYSEWLGGVGFRYAFSIDQITPAQAFLYVQGKQAANPNSVLKYNHEFTYVSKKHDLGTFTKDDPQYSHGGDHECTAAEYCYTDHSCITEAKKFGKIVPKIHWEEIVHGVIRENDSDVGHWYCKAVGYGHGLIFRLKFADQAQVNYEWELNYLVYGNGHLEMSNNILRVVPNSYLFGAVEMKLNTLQDAQKTCWSSDQTQDSWGSAVTSYALPSELCWVLQKVPETLTQKTYFKHFFENSFFPETQKKKSEA